MDGTEPTAFAATVAAVGSAPTTELRSSHFPTGEARFETKSVLGRGGMGTVYVAADTQFGRDVALKEMAAEAASDEGIRRFLVESVITGNLEHPGVPAVYERGLRDGRPFYAMRKVEGRTLGAAISEAKTLEGRLALLPVVVQVANTLGFAHERGVVHRDVKPDNVILGRHGEVVLLDWGIARVRGTAELVSHPSVGEMEPSATRVGSVMGTPAYMAPEQAAGKVDAIDERTDVFALGAMLYHALGGVPPYGGDTSMAVLRRALEGERVPLKRLSPRVPDELEAIVETAMAQAKEDRYPHAAAFAEAVQGFMTGRVLATPSPWLGRAASVLSWLFLALMLFALAMVSRGRIPGLAEQGFSAYFYIATFVIGSVLSVVEWRTRGVHQLSPLILALVGLTVLSGVGGTASGVGMVMAAASDAVPSELSEVLLQGIWEVSGPLTFASLLGSAQLMLWAIARRAVLLHGATLDPSRSGR
ncbi:MAG: serine/threonine-protein kinase [Sandaracinaceae bacterium]